MSPAAAPPGAPPEDPLARLWVHALRAHIDALVVQFEAQVRQHAEGARRAHAEALEGALADARAAQAQAEASGQREARARAQFAGAQRETEALRAELARAGVAGEAYRAEVARLEEALEAQRCAHQTESAGWRAREAELTEQVSRLQGQLRELGQQVATLDEQFAQEKDFVQALLRVSGTALFEGVGAALGQPLEASPACYGALKARKLDGVLAQALRDRGRAVARAPLTDDERAALAALAAASGCVLVEVPAGARFHAGTMDKAATRSEPSEEDLVLECLAPGLRLEGTTGSLVHPRVLVGTA